MPDEQKTKLTSRDLLNRIKAKFCEPEWVVLEEVRNCTGYSHRERYADALAMSTYPSRGLVLYGFEVKVSRQDVQRELKDPDKSVALQQYCDRWYLVVSNPKLVTVDEVPLNWGLITAHGSGLKIVKEGPLLAKDAKARKPWPRDFVASLLRNAVRGAAEEQLRKAERAGFDKGFESGKQDASYVREELSRLTQATEAFRRGSGLRIDRYMSEEWCENVGKKVKALMGLDLIDHVDRTKKLREQLERAVGVLREAEDKAQQGISLQQEVASGQPGA